jgi:hypothetical protein
MSIIPTTVPSQDDQVSQYLLPGLVPFLVLILLALIIYLTTFVHRRFRHLRRHLTSPRDTENSDSSSSTDSESRILWHLDLVAPPKTCKQLRAEMALGGPWPCWATLSSLSICVICLETINGGDVIRHLPCGHTFHSDCITPWYRRRHNTCPICVLCLPQPNLVHYRPGR